MIAFSGGVDSSFLLLAAAYSLKFLEEGKEYGRLVALTTRSPSVSRRELDEAVAFAKSLEVNHVVLESKELEKEAYVRNDGLRCYHCKSELFSLSLDEARKRSCKYIAYGYNASDRRDSRAGQRAALENDIRSPLDDAGLEKEEIRHVLREMGLALAEKPASPCLASRVMTGVRVTSEKLNDIEKMEEILRKAFIKVFRVRLHEEQTENSKPVSYFRIEVSAEEMVAVLNIRDELIQEAKNLGYRWATLDLAGYRMGGGNL